MNYIIGVGGVGSWLAHVIVKLVGADQVVLMDGDTLEDKNLDRQLFTIEDIGVNKAEALAARLKCRSHTEWFSEYDIQYLSNDWLLCCVDNNPARKAVLTACDRYGCKAIIAANEVHSSEAYFYSPTFEGSELDPRVYYPDIKHDESNDVRRASIGCTGEAQEKNRQLVTANFMAGALAAHLYVLWAMEAKTASKETIPLLPHRLYQNLSRNGCVRRVDVQQTQEKGNQ